METVKSPQHRLYVKFSFNLCGFFNNILVVSLDSELLFVHSHMNSPALLKPASRSQKRCCTLIYGCNVKSQFFHFDQKRLEAREKS